MATCCWRLLAIGLLAWLAQAAEVTPSACTAANYTQLHNLTHTNASVCGTGDRKKLELDCSRTATFVRGPAAAPLELSTSLTHDWTISSACQHTIVVNISENAAMPVLLIEGNFGQNSVTLKNLRFLIVGQAPAATGCDGNATDTNCDHRSVIEIVNVENISLVNVQIVNESPDMMPFTGITIKSIAGGEATNVRLDGVSVRRMLHGVRVRGGGILDANNVRINNCQHDGLEYLCSFVQPNRVTIRGKASQFSGNGQNGALLYCEGDMSPSMPVIISDGAVFQRNQQSGLALLGHMHGNVTSARFLSNGAGGSGSGPPACGGGLYVHLSFMTPELHLGNARFFNNSAVVGGGLCLHGPDEDEPLLFRVRSRVTLSRGTTFEHNTAQHCGHGLATVADLTRAQINTTFAVPVPLLFPASAAKGQQQTLCIMAQLSARNDFMEMRLA